MMVFLVLSFACAIYALISQFFFKMFQSDHCEPILVTPEVASILWWIQNIVIYQVWNIPILRYFWPSLGTQERDDEQKRLTEF